MAMRTVEASGANIEEAIEKGLKKLDVSRESVIVEIVEEPNRGLLGLGSKEAVVRLTTVVPPRSERQDFVASTSTTSTDNADQSQATDDTDTQPTPPAERRSPYERRERGRGPGIGGRRYAKKRRDGQQRSSYAQEQQEIASIEPRRETRTVHDDEPIPDGVRVGAETLEELLEHMGIQAEIGIERIQPQEDGEEIPIPWLLHVRGEDLGVLIGRRGETLSALQYITRLIASRDIQARAEFSVDVEEYKARREIQLERLAQRKAEEAVQRGQTVYLDPMTPNERRIVHVTLRDHPDVTTESQGEGRDRHVTIIPKNSKD